VPKFDPLLFLQAVPVQTSMHNVVLRNLRGVHDANHTKLTTR